ncbi:hypothetical protein [Thermofilum sp.]|jgi:uncharacterized membrane protein|uniref:hypothetical protein n=1 Tax=Thermofilum sp. TaxID=1961369 RepID=UPI002588821D|nr:hypothetical protein [Thermofilum sp.]
MRDGFETGLKLVFAGFALVFLAVIVLALLGLAWGSNVTGGAGACIFVFFVPVFCVGAGEPGVVTFLMFLGVILMLVAFVLFVLPLVLYGRGNEEV